MSCWLFDDEVLLLAAVFLFAGLLIGLLIGLLDTGFVFLELAGVDADFGGFPSVFLTFTISV